jgi:hypothetical protein
MKRALLILICLIVHTSLFAQSDKDKEAYATKASQLQADIWGNPSPEFKSTSVPANFSKESAVILARSFSLSRASSGKLKFGRSIGVTTRTTKFSIFHERVKINDKTALESFSTLEYQKKLDKTTSQLFAKFVDVNNTFIGAKVIKPNGKEVTVNTSEEVLVKNESKDQKGKLAIPDLQVGDILDYYVSKEDIADKEEGNSYQENDNLIFLIDEYPVLYYAIDFQFNKKIHVKTIYANGAQHFQENTNEDGDQLYTLKLHNVPKYLGQLWTSGLREYPYIEIGSAYDDNLDKIIEKKNFVTNPMFEVQKYNFELPFSEVIYGVSEMTDDLDSYFKGKKNYQKAPLDSSMRVLYTQWKLSTFYHDNYISAQMNGKSTPAEGIAELNYNHVISRKAVMFMSMALYNLKIDHDILMVASRNTNSLENVFNSNDFDVLIRINGDKPMYMAFDDPFTHFNEIPERFQGEKVVVLHPVKKNSRNYTFSESEDKLPVISSDQNSINEQLNVSLTSSNMQKLKVERHVKESGALRHDDQKRLLPVEDVDNGYCELLNKDNLAKRIPKKMWIPVKTELDKDREKVGKNFTEEIKEKFDQDPQEVSNCKVINPALEKTSPIFEYKEEFVLNNLVKKAGNNYIIDAGKLTGGFLKLEEKDKKRDKDIYMTCARSFKYTIVIDIPQGYAARGMEELAQNKSNKTGSFTSSAVINGNKLSITVSRVYKNNFEKAADWPLLVDIITTASDFDSKKILLEKQN